MDRWQEAFEDGRQCVEMDGAFLEGYWRAALALQKLDSLEGALGYVETGLGVDPSNAALIVMSREIEELQRVKRQELAQTKKK